MKTVLTILIVALTGILACSEQTTTPPATVHGSGSAKIDVGALHNKIVRAFARELAARGENEGEPITRKEFVKLVMKVSNETLHGEGIAHDVTAGEVNNTLNEFVDLRNRGVFDIYSPQPGDPRRIIDDWEQRGILGPQDADAARALLSGDAEPGLFASSLAVEAMNSIWVASRQLWSDPAFRLRSLAGVRYDTTPPDKESLRFQMDTIFGILGMLAGGSQGGAIAGGIASLIIEMAPPPPMPGGESWDCSDYCNMG